MIIDFIIGRDANSQQLRISTFDGKTNKTVGAIASVPMNVSRKHAQLTVNDDGTCTIRNLNDANITRVSGQPVVSKQLRIGDLVELGESRYTLNWDFIRPLIPRTVDISPLKAVWDEYKRQELKIEKEYIKYMILAGVPVTVSMLGTIISSIFQQVRIIAIPVTTIAVIISIYRIYKLIRLKKVDKSENNRQWLIEHYTCPECGRFMGFEYYNILIQNSACPYCKAKFKK